MLWPVLEAIFQLTFRYDNSDEAVYQRMDFLRREKIGICDIVESCYREKPDASDLGMKEIRLRDVLGQVSLHKKLTTLIFTGGNTKNGPEYLFRKLLCSKRISFHCTSTGPPRLHWFVYAGRKISTISITSPSNSANRAIGASLLYKKLKTNDATYSPFKFRVEQYKKVFLGGE